MAGRRSCLYVLMLVLLSMELGCQSVTTQKSGVTAEKKYGTTKGTFRGRWWHYYERGISYADDRFWRNAEADLREAVRRREKDQRRARTYGMHFIDYFPHRELGVVLYRQERYEEALAELEASLKSEESARAQFYLDRTRKALIDKHNTDARPPHILMKSPAEGSISNRFVADVSGTARDDTFVKSVRVNDVPVRLDVAAPEVPFHVEVPLSAGENRIQISVQDLSGKTTLVERAVRVDRQAPVLTIDEPGSGQARSEAAWRLKGYACDDSGIEEILVNGHKILHAPAREVRLDHSIPPMQPGETLIVEAMDMAGNRTRAEIDPGKATSRPKRALLASLDLSPLAFLGEASPQADDAPPVIELREWTEDQTVFLDRIYLEGRVRDESGVEFLSINGQSILRRPGKNVFFGYLAKLNEGENLFRIESADSVGNRVVKEYRVHRKLQRVREVGSRLAVVLLPLEHKGARGAFGGAVEEMLLGTLLERRRFKLVERDRLEEILREQKLGQSELADPKAAVRVGKIVAAQGVLVGSMSENAGTVEIYLRLVDTETSLVIAGVDVYGEDLDVRTLRELCQGLILKLCDEVPLVEGLVVEVKEDRIMVDLGKKSKVKNGMRLVLFEEREPIRHPVTGAVLGADAKELGYAIIDLVHDHMSSARMLDEKSAVRIRPMHKVITQ